MFCKPSHLSNFPARKQLHDGWLRMNLRAREGSVGYRMIHSITRRSCRSSPKQKRGFEDYLNPVAEPNTTLHHSLRQVLPKQRLPLSEPPMMDRSLSSQRFLLPVQAKRPLSVSGELSRLLRERGHLHHRVEE